MESNIKRLGLMVDMSRNAVMSVDALKKFLPLLRKMGYNSFMLYTEDTYEIEERPFFGYMRGRYSTQELREIDDFANSIGMELIPCIQTLAHLRQAFKWGTVPVDYEDVLLVDDEKTYELIDDMFKTVKKCFRSEYIHIGMDEAQAIGKGAHLKKHGYEPTIQIILRHLKKVCEIAKKYDLKPIMWSDMFFNSANLLGQTGEIGITKEELGDLMSFVTPVYWDYSALPQEHFENKIQTHKELFDNVWYAGGLYNWYGYIPLNDLAIKMAKTTVSAAKKEGLATFYTTLWGDDGAECSCFANLPSLFYTAALAKGCTDEDKIKADFKEIVGGDFDDFMLLDLPNRVDPTHEGAPMGGYTHWPLHPSKVMLFSDYFNDFLDCTVNDGIGEKYGEVAKKLYAAKKRNPEFAYIFDTAAKLCDVLEYKYELGIKTRRAYESGDLKALRLLAKKDYAIVEKRLIKFTEAMQKQWFTDNKPQGFDIQDLRLGGMIRRTKACRQRILDYVNGKISLIPEYEEKLLPLPESADLHTGYSFFVSPNILVHRL